MNRGLWLAAAYAVKPNELGSCGEDKAHETLADYVKNPDESKEAAVRALLERFEVAAPYCHLIAGANGIEDPFDARVVEAYWLGDPSLENVKPQDISRVIKEDVGRCGWSAEQIALLFSGLLISMARAHHSLSVLYFFLRPGSKMILPPELKKRCDECRVCWGRVIEISPKHLVVEYQPLIFPLAGFVAFDEPMQRTIDRGFVDTVSIGDWVSFHLNMGIQVLSAEQVANLEFYTAKTLAAVSSKENRQ